MLSSEIYNLCLILWPVPPEQIDRLEAVKELENLVKKQWDAWIKFDMKLPTRSKLEFLINCKVSDYFRNCSNFVRQSFLSISTKKEYLLKMLARGLRMKLQITRSYI